MSVRKEFFSVCFFLLVFSYISISASELDAISGELKTKDSLTIGIVKTNNTPLNVQAAFYPFPSKPSDPEMKKLRRLTTKDCNLSQIEEFVAMRRALSWVHSQWSHHPTNSIAQQSTSLEILDRAKKGDRFTCVEYSKVLTDILICWGYPARMVGLTRRSITNPTPGARHVGVEAWSNRQNKWIYLDPQFGTFPMQDTFWLNAFEFGRALDDGSLSLQIYVATKNDEKLGPEEDSLVSSYRTYIVKHTRFVDIPFISNGNLGMLMCVPSDRTPPLLFQGTPMSNIEYTYDAKDLYAPLGKVNIIMKYNYSANRPESPMEHPEYILKFVTSSPWIQYFEVQCDNGEWKKIASDNYKWFLHEGLNDIRVRAITASGHHTLSSDYTLFHGIRNEFREIRAEERKKKLQQEPVSGEKGG